MTQHSTAPAVAERQFELCYAGLVGIGRGFAFPCDAAGVVDLDRLSTRGRINYFYARAVVGMELCAPMVMCVG